MANLREDDDAAAAADSNDDDNDDETMSATVVTNSPVPSEEVVGGSDLDTMTAACANRAAGLVCICHPCEASHTRLLHRTIHQHRSSAAGGASGDLPHAALGAGDGALVVTKAAANSNSNKRARMALLASTATSVITTTTPAHTTANDSNPSNNAPEDQKLAKLTAACRTILECIGEDPDREGLLKTPERWAKALQFMCHGYSMTAQDVTNGAVFSENHNEMVVVRNIDIHSLCEHHMVPFTGHVHIGYIPNGKIVSALSCDPC